MNSLGIDKPVEETRVVVAMSGGVDSSVVAVMLKKQGYEVIGVTLQLYDHGAALQKKGACCAGQDIHDARRVAEQFDFPHYVLNYENKFRESVMDDFVETYLAGETPIPCVRCNQSVKFRDLLTTAQELGADVMATGHYVQRGEYSGVATLERAIDTTKDQSYFLFATTQEQLDFLRFPLGGMHKEQTRALAAEYGLSLSNKPDSQDICFVPNGDYAAVIEKIRPDAAEEGMIVHVDGTVLGTHPGILHYTVGQRRGLGIAWHEPLYVVRIDPENKAVMVGPKSALMTEQFQLREVNWLADAKAYQHPVEVMIKWRSVQAPKPALCQMQPDGAAEITLLQADEAVAPGQACVMYDENRVLGGGWITRAHHSRLASHA